MTYNPNPPPRLRRGLASARERQKPIPQASAMIDLPRYYIALSVLPIVALFLVALVIGWLNRERAGNERRKERFLKDIGYDLKLKEKAGEEQEKMTGRTNGTNGTSGKPTTLRQRNPDLKTRASASSKTPQPTSASAEKSVTSTSSRPLIIGFWHPYCNAGGGGERVLWTAIYWALRQQNRRQKPKGEIGTDRGRKVICVVYSGDYPGVGKEEILGRVQTRFHLPLLQPPYLNSIHFLPLPSRRLISDGYWSRFTLLGQSLGSIYVCAEGCGVDFGLGLGLRRGLGRLLGRRKVEEEEQGWKRGFWPDVFIDTMGHPFTLPLLSFLSGSTVPLGAYVHYPVISTDMIGRVRNGVWGVESGSEADAGVEGGGDGVAEKKGEGGLKGWRRLGKLAYYHAFTRAYATSLLFADEIMTNSSWTSGHITSLLKLGRGTWAAYLLNLDDAGRSKAHKTGAVNKESKENKEEREDRNDRVVFPPCDTSEFLHLPLENRHQSHTLISLAQFRPEKDQAKQLRALAVLFERYPQWRDVQVNSDEQNGAKGRTGKEKAGSSKGVKLVLMGSCRDEADERRIDGLRRLAVDLGIEDNVEFITNAPFPTLVSHLGSASIGLNTMKDEHFGIGVVEFMASGLIPLVHQSAGPWLDIVVPLDGQVTGYHATTASSFADQIHKILSLPSSTQLSIRRAAREQAIAKFSQECFESGWEVSWDKLLGQAERGMEERRREELEQERRAR